MELRLRALPSLVGWGATFLRNSRAATYERNSLSNLRLALYSLKVMQSLRLETGIDYGRTARGSLKIFRDWATLDRASEAASQISAEGINTRQLSRSDIVDLEPALAPIADQLVGAIHYGDDETGDAYRFCVELAAHAQQLGVDFRFRTEVSSVEMRSNRVSAMKCGRKRFVMDLYVVAAGSYSTPLLRHTGIRLPVRPVKGYAITVDNPQEPPLLRFPVIDDHWHAAVVPLVGALRVAGTAEFAGYDLTLQPARIRNLVSLLRQVLPRAKLDAASLTSWCGLRPMSADGVPIIGRTSISNLLVNTGHGHLGWTMAAASGQLLANLMSGHSPSVDPMPYSLARFSPSGCS
jgi:D-amino-acid dehydrogenase